MCIPVCWSDWDHFIMMHLKQSQQDKQANKSRIERDYKTQEQNWQL